MRTALVTGASRGIGRGIAMALANRGFGLTVTSRTQSDLDALAVDLRAAGAPVVVAEEADLSDLDALSRIVAAHRMKFGALSALMLSGGVGTASPIAEAAVHRSAKTLSVNVLSSMVLATESLPLLRAAAQNHPDTGARVIALSSITGAFAEPGLAAYGASKAALSSFVETLNAEESRNGVMATAIAPGYVDTDMSAWVSHRVPLASMIKVEDVVAVVNMLLELGASASITRINMTRSGTTGYEA